MASTIEELVDILERAKMHLEPRRVVLGDAESPIEITLEPTLVTIRASDLGPIPASEAGRAEFLELLLRANANLVGLAFCIDDDQVHLTWRRAIADVDEAHLQAALSEIERALQVFPLAAPSPLSQSAREQLELDAAVIEAKKALAILIAEEKRLARQRDGEHHNAAEWERRSALALTAKDEALAGEALGRKVEHDAMARSLDAALQPLANEVNRSKQQLRSLDERCAALRRKRAAEATARAIDEARSRLTDLRERLDAIEGAHNGPP